MKSKEIIRFIVHMDSPFFEGRFLCGRKYRAGLLHTRFDFDFLKGARKMRWCLSCADRWMYFKEKQNKTMEV